MFGKKKKKEQRVSHTRQPAPTVSTLRNSYSLLTTSILRQMKSSIGTAKNSSKIKGVIFFNHNKQYKLNVVEHGMLSSNCTNPGHELCQSTV